MLDWGTLMRACLFLGLAAQHSTAQPYQLNSDTPSHSARHIFFSFLFINSIRVAFPLNRERHPTFIFSPFGRAVPNFFSCIGPVSHGVGGLDLNEHSQKWENLNFLCCVGYLKGKGRLWKILFSYFTLH